MAAALGFLLPGAVAVAQVPNGSGIPPADAFQILYYTVDYDEEGEPRRGRLMTEQDLAGTFVNRARCECGQEIWARIVLQPGNYINEQIRTYVGNRCDDAQELPLAQVKPCVQLYESVPQSYRNGIDLVFHPVWLARGIDGTNQTVNNAVAFGTCESGRGDAGIWICMEQNGQPDCQAEEFIIRGDRNQNVPDKGASIRYDFDTPFTTPTDIRVQAGDGAVITRWTQTATDSEGGFRVLCADQNGNPVPGKGFTLRSITGLNLGTQYFTQENLCPDGPFSEVSMRDVSPSDLPPDPIPDPDPDPDPDGDRDPDVGFDGWPDDSVSFQETGTTGDEGETTGTTGGTGGTDTDTDTDSTTGAGGPTSPSDAAVAALESLDWSYVCTGHLAFNSNSARVTGLQNEEPYHFLLVSYDRAGNPVPVSEIMTATPRETHDLWDQCEVAGVCGTGGYCACTADEPRPMGALGALLGLLVGAGGVLNRRRRRRQ